MKTSNGSSPQANYFQAKQTRHQASAAIVTIPPGSQGNYWPYHVKICKFNLIFSVWKRGFIFIKLLHAEKYIKHQSKSLCFNISATCCTLSSSTCKRKSPPSCLHWWAHTHPSSRFWHIKQTPLWNHQPSPNGTQHCRCKLPRNHLFFPSYMCKSLLH